MSLQKTLTFHPALKVGRQGVTLVRQGIETPAVLKLGRVGSRPRLTVFRAGMLTTYAVADDALRLEGHSAGEGKIEEFLRVSAASVARIEI